MEASEACTHQIMAFKQMKNHHDRIDLNVQDAFNQEEKRSLLEIFEKRVEYSRSAYSLSRQFIDPNLRVQTTFALALALYNAEYFQSAAYYFGQVLSISTILLESQQPFVFGK